MLAITKSAANAIREIVSYSDQPETAGVRISSRQVDEEGTALQLSPADAPEEADQVLDLEGLRIFVAPEAASQLEDRLLDAQIARDGPMFRFSKQRAPEDHMWTGSKYSRTSKVDPFMRAAEMQAKLGATKLKMNADAVAGLTKWLEGPEAETYDSELAQGLDVLCKLWSQPPTRGFQTAFGTKISASRPREW